jgi:NifU-like domain
VSADFRERVNRVEALVGALEKCPDPTAREASRELVRTLLDLHAAGLTKVLELASGDSGLIDQLADDELVSSLLLLHGLHPRPVAERVLRALEMARPRFRSMGGDVELIDASDEVVRLRLRGEPVLRAIAEEVVIGAAPDAALEFEEASDPFLAGRVSLPLMASVGSRP